jgi:hypothetical protein
VRNRVRGRRQEAQSMRGLVQIGEHLLRGSIRHLPVHHHLRRPPHHLLLPRLYSVHSTHYGDSSRKSSLLDWPACVNQTYLNSPVHLEGVRRLDCRRLCRRLKDFRLYAWLGPGIRLANQICHLSYLHHIHSRFLSSPVRAVPLDHGRNIPTIKDGRTSFNSSAWPMFRSPVPFSYSGRYAGSLLYALMTA